MINDLPASIWKLLCLFILFLIVFDLIFVRWKKLSSLDWKKTEYIWLGVAALGLISMSAQVRNWLAINKAQTARLRAENYYSFLRSYAGGSEPPNYVCMKFVRSEYSPDNLDEAQAEYDKFCAWNKQLLEKLPLRIPNDLADLKYSEYQPDKTPHSPPLIDYLSTIKMYFNQYQIYRNEYISLNNCAERSELEMTLFYISPVLLCFALALRITKVTGDIKTERIKQQG
jgi:hypothetical protein